ncbi:SWIM zinc finger family protein [Halorussus halobius]|uniref:SWIM zinc finger family protein n=1 Tax=Halorussus halobius TaxID=1710537 RepID=UPI001B2FF0E9
MTASAFAPTCSCPYAGPGACKHVVAVLLALTGELPADVDAQSDSRTPTAVQTTCRTTGRSCRNEQRREATGSARVRASIGRPPEGTVEPAFLGHVRADRLPERIHVRRCSSGIEGIRDGYTVVL